MNRKLLASVIVINLALLTGCATLNEDQCMVADWYQIGFTDGTNGEPESYLEKHQKACAKHGVGTNLNEWLYGREAGLKSYCTAARGFEEGLKNRTYHGVCFGEAGFQFESAYQDGQHIYQQQQLIQDLENQITSAHDELNDFDDEWRYLQRQLRQDNLSREDRRVLLNRLDHVKDRTAELNAHIAFLTGRLDHELYLLNNMQN